MNRYAWFSALFASDVRSAAKLVGSFLFQCSNPDGISFPSIGTIADATGYCRRTVIDAISDLETEGLISIERKTGRSSSYRLVTNAAPVPVQETAQPIHNSLTGAESAPVQEMHKPVQEMHPPVQEMHNTSAGDAHITTVLTTIPNNNPNSAAERNGWKVGEAIGSDECARLGLPQELANRTKLPPGKCSLAEFEFLTFWNRYRSEQWRPTPRNRERAEVLCLLFGPEALEAGFREFAKADRSSISYLAKCLASLDSTPSGASLPPELADLFTPEDWESLSEEKRIDWLKTVTLPARR